MEVGPRDGRHRGADPTWVRGNNATLVPSAILINWICSPRGMFLISFAHIDNHKGAARFLNDIKSFILKMGLTPHFYYCIQYVMHTNFFYYKHIHILNLICWSALAGLCICRRPWSRRGSTRWQGPRRPTSRPGTSPAGSSSHTHSFYSWYGLGNFCIHSL